MNRKEALFKWDANKKRKRKENILATLRTQPLHHLVKIQGVTTAEPCQISILESVARYERTVVSACHDIGKTWTAAKIVLWFTSTFQGAKVITTAPTFNQVKRLLWAEIRAGYSKSKMHLGGEMLVTEWKINPDWFALGFTSKGDANQGEGQGEAASFQGFHSKYLLVVFDEATGISASIWKQLEGLLTSGYVRFLGIGNPTTKDCEFYKCFTLPGYNKIYLTCFDSPNFHANHVQTKALFIVEFNRLSELSKEAQETALEAYRIVNAYLITVRWVMRMCLRWGLNHPLVVSKCFGEFPEEDDFVLIPLGIVQRAQLRTYTPGPSDRVAYGVDVARFGSDKTVLTKIKGRQVTEKRILVHRDTMEIVGVLVQMITTEASTEQVVAIDATGIGSGVVDAMKERRNEGVIPRHVEIRECHFGELPAGKTSGVFSDEMKKKYANLKARIFVELQESLKADLCLLEDEEYLEELPTIKYAFDSKGRWVIESKEDFKKRTGRGSPDSADSLALANYARTDAIRTGEFMQAFAVGRLGTVIPGNRTTDLW